MMRYKYSGIVISLRICDPCSWKFVKSMMSATVKSKKHPRWVLVMSANISGGLWFKLDLHELPFESGQEMTKYCISKIVKWAYLVPCTEIKPAVISNGLLKSFFLMLLSSCFVKLCFLCNSSRVLTLKLFMSLFVIFRSTFSTSATLEPAESLNWLESGTEFCSGCMNLRFWTKAFSRYWNTFWS